MRQFSKFQIELNIETLLFRVHRESFFFVPGEKLQPGTIILQVMVSVLVFMLSMLIYKDGTLCLK